MPMVGGVMLCFLSRYSTEENTICVVLVISKRVSAVARLHCVDLKPLQFFTVNYASRV